MATLLLGMTAVACVIGASGGASAQMPAGPSLQITQGTLGQVGEDLRLKLRFSRDVPVKQLPSRRPAARCSEHCPSPSSAMAAGRRS